MSAMLRTLSLLIAGGLIGFGLFVGDDLSDARWLGLLGIAFIFLLIGTRITLPMSTPVFNRGLIRTTMVLASVFVLISAQLVRIQVIQQDTMYYRTEADANGEVISNPRLYQQQLTVQRGKIVDRNGVVLADTYEQDGIYYRTWPVESAFSVTGYYSPNRYGATGLEATYEEHLSGSSQTNPVESTIRDLFGQEQQGADIQLTIDAELQTLAYNSLAGNNGAVVVLDIQTGETLVLASRPSVNPNTLFVVDSATEADAYWNSLTGDSSGQPFVTRANMGVYTPGSTFKTVTAGIAIEEGISDPEKVYEDDGDTTIDGRVLVELNRPDPSRSEWTLREAIMWSLNVVMAQVGLDIDGDTFWQYGPQLGFGDRIPYDVPVSNSQLANSESFLQDPNARADTGFGQGEILMSPLHLAMMASMWANDGQMMQPILVDKVIASDGRVLYQPEPAVYLTCFDPNTAQAVEGMMVDVVARGSAQHGQAQGYVIGGKTGTAERGDGLTNSLFIGFIGDPEPRYAIAVVLEGSGDQLPSAVAMSRDILVATMDRRPGD